MVAECRIIPIRFRVAGQDQDEGSRATGLPCFCAAERAKPNHRLMNCQVMPEDLPPLTVRRGKVAALARHFRLDGLGL